jgi:hypothetical protein
MARHKLLVWTFLLAGTFASCDLSVPDKPNFTTSQALEIPFIDNKEYVFMGDSTGALIDTTSEDLDSLFTIGGDGSITISTEEEFDFGDLNDAVPEVDAPSTSFNSAVGEIEIGSFSSGGGDLGSTNFAEITGGATPPVGTPVPAGDNSAMPVNIDIGASSDFFTSATIRDGSLDIGVTNELGFDIQTLEITLLSNGIQVGTAATFNNLVNGASETAGIVFSDGDELANISVDVVITWDGFNYPANDGDLIINTAEGNDLFASSVTANLEPQDFSTSNTTNFSDTEFQFTDASHYVQLQSGEISVTDLVNNMGIGIETLQISFPGIRNGNFSASDSLVINFPAIARNSTANDLNVDLTGYRLYALNNEVTYNIVAATENTQSGPNAGAVTITENDDITASVNISNLEVASAFGIVLSQTVLLGDNDVSNDTGTEVLDVFNDLEADTTSIDGLDEFSEDLDGLSFTNPSIDINYNTNIGISTTIYAAMVGIDGNGEAIYLSGKSGSPNEVTAGDPITGLVANGQQLLPTQLIKFEIDNVSDCVNNTCQISFNTTTTNVDDFLNNLPSEIRFVGRAIVNEDENEGTISTPLTFDPTLSVDLPLAISTESGSPISYRDTTDVELDLGDDQTLSEARFFMTYTNNLPLGLSVDLIFEDSLGIETGFTLPNAGESIELIASPVDQTSRFSTGGTENSLVFSLNEDQLAQLPSLNRVIYEVSMQTSGNSNVRLRASDTFILSLAAKLRLETKVGGE